MSLLGKILTFLNVLAAIGFFVMAGMDWNKRQLWAEAVIEHKLLFEGLPLDEHEMDLEGNPRSKDLEQKAVQKLFQQAGAGGSPEKDKWTQVDELKRVKSELQRRFEDAAVKGTKGEKVADVLIHLATSMKERLRLKELATDEKKTEQLESEFNQVFDEPLSAGETSGPPKHTPEQRRQMIAHLVCATADILRQGEGEGGQVPAFTESKAYKRALATTGLGACSREVEAEATDLQHFTDDIMAGVDRDRALFLSSYHDRLAQIEDLAEKVERQRAWLRLQKDMVDNQRTLVEARQAEVNKLEKVLAAAREATREQLAVQLRMERELFKSRQEQRDAFETNLRLEQRLRTMEKGR
jgi:hypothetical protein